jgi:flagellar basal-body rod modification protein FlgD
MTTVNSSVTDVLDKYRLKTDDTPKSNELGKSAFLELMIAQLNNQSPTDPQDNSQWVAQLAQFSSVESLENLNTSVDAIAGNYRSSQALQASAMVGRDVLVTTDSAYKTANGEVKGVAELPAGTSDMKISVFNEAGELIRQASMGQQSGGQIPFGWDGRNEKGEIMPAGNYRVAVDARYSGEMTQMATYMAANVDSVSIDGKGSVTLNLGGKGSVGLADIKQIY